MVHQSILLHTIFVLIIRVKQTDHEEFSNSIHLYCYMFIYIKIHLRVSILAFLKKKTPLRNSLAALTTINPKH